MHPSVKALIERQYLDRPTHQRFEETHSLTTCRLALGLLREEGFAGNAFAEAAMLLNEDLPRRSGSVSSAFAQGLIFREFDDPRGRFAARALGSDLVVEAAIGASDAVVAIRGTACRARLAGRLPETVVTALRGERVSRVLGHPLPADCQSTIASVQQRGGSSRLGLWFSDAPC